jgi:hypothetical protein
MGCRKSVIPGLTFSWKRALGITGARQRPARNTGIPATKQVHRKVSASLSGVLFAISSGSKK